MLRKDTARLVTKLRLKEIRDENQRLADQQKYKEMFAAEGINLSSVFKKGGLSSIISDNYRSRQQQRDFRGYNSNSGASPTNGNRMPRNNNESATSIDPSIWKDITGGLY